METAVKGRRPSYDARRRLARNRAAVTGALVLATLILLAVVGPWLVPYRYDEINKDDVWLAPLVHDHLLGSDALGRDLLARLLMGLRVSLAIGVVATSVSLVVGVLWGATAGYLGGAVDELMMRVVDVLYSLPVIFFVILLMVTFGSNIVLIFVAIGAVEWLTMARIVRGQTLSPEEEGIHRGGARRGPSRTCHHRPSHRAQPSGACGRLCDPDHTRGDPGGKLPELSWPWACSRPWRLSAASKSPAAHRIWSLPPGC